MEYVGIPLGLVNGALGGVVAIAFLKSLVNANGQSFKSTMIIVVEIMAIPTFLLGGPWVATKFMEGVDFILVLPMYATSIGVSFFLVSAFPIIRYIIVMSKF